MSTTTEHTEFRYDRIVSYVATPEQALEQLKSSKVSEQEWQRTGDYWHKALAERNLAKLDDAIDRQTEYVAQLAKEETERQEASAKYRAEREQAAEAKLKDELLVSFRVANPGASESDFESVYPRLKVQRQIDRMNAVMVQARNNPAYSV